MEPSEDAARRPDARTVRGIEDAERQFFAGHYAEHRYNAVGWRLRLQRDVDVVLRANGGRSLGRVLSVGCGDGEFELMLAPRAEFVVGIDLTPEAIDAARKAQAVRGIENVEFLCRSVADLRLDDRFDTIVCVAFLHHLPAAALTEFLITLSGLLRPGGLFYAQDPNVHGLLRLVGRWILGKQYDAYHTPDERELDPRELVDALASAGFVETTIRHIDLTLIPMLYAAPHGPDILFRACALIDRAWCVSPLQRWGSGFSTIARRPLR